MPARFGTATPTTGVTMNRAAVSSTPGLELDAIGSGYRLHHASGLTRGTCAANCWDELRAVKLIGFRFDATRRPRFVAASFMLALPQRPDSCRGRPRPTSCSSTARSSRSIATSLSTKPSRSSAIASWPSATTIRCAPSPDRRRGMIDLKGHAVIPGLMDNHLHGAGGGPGVDLSRARSMADVIAALQARVDCVQTGRRHCLEQRLA